MAAGRGKFYDIVAECISQHNGSVVKFLDDGAIAEFSDGEAEPASARHQT